MTALDIFLPVMVVAPAPDVIRQTLEKGALCLCFRLCTPLAVSIVGVLGGCPRANACYIASERARARRTGAPSNASVDGPIFEAATTAAWMIGLCQSGRPRCRRTPCRSNSVSFAVGRRWRWPTSMGQASIHLCCAQSTSPVRERSFSRRSHTHSRPLEYSFAVGARLGSNPVTRTHTPSGVL